MNGELCLGLTVKNKPCKREATTATHYCGTHQDQAPAVAPATTVAAALWPVSGPVRRSGGSPDGQGGRAARLMVSRRKKPAYRVKKVPYSGSVRTQSALCHQVRSANVLNGVDVHARAKLSLFNYRRWHANVSIANR